MDGGSFITEINGESGNISPFNTSARLTTLNISLTGIYLYETGNIFNVFTGGAPTESGRMYKFFQVVPIAGGNINYFSGNNLFTFLSSPNYSIFNSKDLIIYSKISGDNYLIYSGYGPSNEVITGITPTFAGYRDL